MCLLATVPQPWQRCQQQQQTRQRRRHQRHLYNRRRRGRYWQAHVCADGFQYVYQSLSGDGEIIANVASLTGGGSVSKAGLMIRESLAADAVHVSALVRGNRIRVFERTTTGGSTTKLPGANNGAPEWLRIVRTGNSTTTLATR